MGTCNKCKKKLEPNTDIVQFTSMTLDNNGEVKEGSEDYLELFCMDCYESIVRA